MKHLLIILAFERFGKPSNLLGYVILHTVISDVSDLKFLYEEIFTKKNEFRLEQLDAPGALFLTLRFELKS